MRRPYILMIAPHAPPKNTAEAIQVGRLLQALSGKAEGQVVSATAAGGWAVNDSSLAPLPAGFTQHALRLPLHGWASRVLDSSHLAFLQQPDALFWMRYCVGSVLRQLPRRPDIIYSRSGPLSGALLAQQLKQRLHIPWIMHLSDPWADSPYRHARIQDHMQEADCMDAADGITVTTQGQADFYRAKYTQHAAKITVSPNMLPETEGAMNAAQRSPEAPLALVFAGNFYANRSPETLVHALELLRSKQPELLQHLQVSIYGHAQPEALQWLGRTGSCLRYHGAVSYGEAQAAQQQADILLSIEPAMNHPLAGSFLPSKILEAMALGKPLLALTPDGSETAALCHDGFGWAVAPTANEALAAELAECIRTRTELRLREAKTPPERYRADHVAKQFLMQLGALGIKVTS